MRRLLIRTNSEGPKSSRKRPACEERRHFSFRETPLRRRIFVYRRNRGAKYGREIWRGRRTCSRATMRSHPLSPSPPLHDPSPFDRPTTPTSTHHTTFWADAADDALPPDFTPHSSSSSSFRPRSGGRSRFAGEREVAVGESRVSGIPSAIIRPHSLTHSTPAAADDFMLASSTHQVLLRACGSGQGQ